MGAVLGGVGGGVLADASLQIGSGFRGTLSCFPGPRLAEPSHPFFPCEGRLSPRRLDRRAQFPGATPPSPRGPESRGRLGRGREDGQPASQGAQGAGETVWVLSWVTFPENVLQASAKAGRMI